MLFPTYTFFFFFLLVLPANWALKRWPLAWRLFLVAVSYFFYATWNITFLGILAGMSLFNHIVGGFLARQNNPVSKKILLFGAIILNLGILGLFKYYDFFRVSAETLLTYIGLQTTIPFLDILLPIGLSFYILRAISYLVEIFTQRVLPSSLLDFSLYIAFFPQLLSGPIAKPQEFLKQIEHGGAKIIERPQYYIGLIIRGLIKKVVIASYFSVFIIEPVFALPQSFSSLAILIGIYAYALTLYCDFSGYSDLAIGIAGLLGFTSPPNFLQPYFIHSIQGFWRTWHISFSSWLRDYVYIPLGGSHNGTLRTHCNLVFLMIVSGMWHGVGYTYLAWGFIHGIGLSIHRLFSQRFKLCSPLLSWCITFHFVCFAWIFFRSETIQHALVILTKFIAWDTTSKGVALFLPLLLMLAFLILRFENVLVERYEKLMIALPFIFQVVVISCIIILIQNLGPDIIPPFTYFTF